MHGRDEHGDEPDLPSALMSPAGTVGWYAYRSDGSRPVSDDDEDPFIEAIKLVPAGVPGPFYVMEQVPEEFQHLFASPPFIALSDDFDELHHWLGIGQETYDAAMDWNRRWADSNQRAADREACEAERQSLLTRMRVEAHEGISFV